MRLQREGNVRNIIETKQFGFIVADGTEYFFHKSECITPFENLKPGDKVRYKAELRDKGWRASDVELI